MKANSCPSAPFVDESRGDSCPSCSLSVGVPAYNQRRMTSHKRNSKMSFTQRRMQGRRSDFRSGRPGQWRRGRGGGGGAMAPKMLSNSSDFRKL